MILSVHRSTLITGLASIVLFLFLLRLGFWQLDRAAQKQAIAAEYAARATAPKLDLAQLDGRDPHLIRWRHVQATGRYAQPDLLLDNRMRSGAVGMDVLSPFTLANGATVLVDRGWVAAAAARDHYPAIITPTSPTTINGIAGPPAFTGVRLNAAADIVETLRPGLLRIQRINLPVLEPHVGTPLEPYIVYLDPTAAHGFDRRRPPPGNDAARHEAYATQWFTMAAILVIIIAARIFRDKPGVDRN